MNYWTNAEWYPALVRGKDLLFVGDWILAPTGDQSIELINSTGDTVEVKVDDDGVCRARTSCSVLPLPDEVVEAVRELLNLS